jgi:uncharacterized protein DUF2628
MPAYAVYEPPMHNSGAADLADRFIFVRDGFSLGAFLFGALWMIWRRLWLVLLIYLVVVAALEYGLVRLGVGTAVRTSVLVLIAFLIGIEAATLRRWTLLRRGWRDCGVVIASDVEMAERRFFDARAVRRPATVSTSTPLAAPAPPEGPGVIGLFPEPGGGG